VTATPRSRRLDRLHVLLIGFVAAIALGLGIGVVARASPGVPVLRAYDASSGGESASTTSALNVGVATAAGDLAEPGFSGAAVVAFRNFSAAEELPTLEIDAGRMPNIASNVQSALDEGQPGVLNRITDPGQIASNRAAATSGFSGPGSPDEYPFASTAQGGAGARVAGVPLAEQRIQSGVLSQFYARNGIGDGDPFAVKVTGLEP